MNNLKNTLSFLVLFISLLFLSNCQNKEFRQTNLDKNQIYSTRYLGIPDEVEEISKKVELEVRGKIPVWLQGTLIRNGPGKFKIGEQYISHWFDGFALLSSFIFTEGKIYYNSAYLQSDQLLASIATDSIQLQGFAQNFGNISPSHLSKDRQKTITANANINIEKIGNHYIALGETPLPIEFEPYNLQTKGIFDYDDHLRKAHTWESAHMKKDPANNSLYNFYIDYGRDSAYVLYKIEDCKSSRIPLARVKVDKPSYMHDFSITKNYIIFTAYPLVVDPIDLLNPKLSFMGAHTWEPKRRTHIYVFEKQTGRLIKEFFTKPMFAFHHINSYEIESTKIDLYLNAYNDPQIIEKISAYPRNYRGATLRKLTLDMGASSEVSELVISEEAFEMPNIRGDLVGTKNQYFYSIWYTPSNIYQGFGLTKYNIANNETISWTKEGYFPGEPVFVATPTGHREDEGIILSIVFNSIEKESYLMIFNASTMKELARAILPQILPFGIHGKFFKEINKTK
jgi:beta,beta-carotene 9',10'-dioxygenase